MKLPIGFMYEDLPAEVIGEQPDSQAAAPVKSLVQVYFPGNNQTLTYFNDQFDLHKGDLVFVEGKLEGVRGIVREVIKNFKIKAADYKKVISVADTRVSGQLYMAGSHFVSFEPTVLPYEQIRGWYLPPAGENDEYEEGHDDTAFSLDKLEQLQASQAVFERGYNYYLEDRVVYLWVSRGRGKAIVEGKQVYEVEFGFVDGQIRELTCSCPCGYVCKHQVAAMLQLRDVLNKITKNHAQLLGDHFAALVKSELFRFAVEGKETGSIVF